MAKRPAKTKDGKKVALLANMGFIGESAGILEKGAQGVGLLRTEFLYMENSAYPSEERQLAAYSHVAQKMQQRPLTIRTLDVGGDKALPYSPMMPEANPALGCRAIRHSLQNLPVFKTQLRAILRAASQGNVQILYPMVASLEEVKACKALLKECREELHAEGLAYGEKIKTGVMIEVPALIWMIDILAPHVDFFSIGSNDLTQYILAADRDCPGSRSVYNHFHPAVLRAIHQVVAAAAAFGKSVSICGEIAGDTLALPLLLGLGIYQLSMDASAIPQAKHAIACFSSEEASQLAQKALQATSGDEVQQLLQNFASGTLATPPPVQAAARR